MAQGSYWNGKRWVKEEDFRRPAPGPKKPPRKQPPRPQPKESRDGKKEQ